MISTISPNWLPVKGQFVLWKTKAIRIDGLTTHPSTGKRFVVQNNKAIPLEQCRPLQGEYVQSGHFIWFVKEWVGNSAIVDTDKYFPID